MARNFNFACCDSTRTIKEVDRRNSAVDTQHIFNRIANSNVIHYIISFIIFNPDTSDHTIEEWLSTATKLKEELNVGDVLMIAKAGEALKGRAHGYYCDWRPMSRTWKEFCSDFVVAFPDRETPGTRAFIAATLRSRDCDTLGDYGIRKVRAIQRFCSAIPWETIVSMIDFGLDHAEAQATIRIQQPKTEREIFKLLTEFDARRRKHRMVSDLRVTNFVNNRVNDANNETLRRRNKPVLKSKCFNCGQLGHHQVACQNKDKNTFNFVNNVNDKEPDKAIKKPEETPPTCNHCKKIGHFEKNCWFKYGKPKKVMFVNRGRSLAATPVATVLCNNKAFKFTYLIDSGADISILSNTAAKKLGVYITPSKRALSGFGAEIVYSIGTCTVIAILPTITLEILFTVVPYTVLPHETDSLIGWDVIGRKHLKIKKNNYGLELHHDLTNTTKLMNVNKVQDLININVSGLDEHDLLELKQILLETRELTPDCITTGKLRIRLKDDIPVAYRPRRLAYAERIKVQEIVSELLKDGIIQESSSAYASPIVLVKKKTEIFVCA